MHSKKEKTLVRGKREMKIPHRVIIRHTFYDFFEQTHVLRELAVFDPAADQIAENAAEILVARIGQETSRIREHADEIAEQAEIAQRRQLVCHADLVVVKPPRGTLLDFPDGVRILEAADNRADGRVVGGV